MFEFGKKPICNKSTFIIVPQQYTKERNLLATMYYRYLDENKKQIELILIILIVQQLVAQKCKKWSIRLLSLYIIYKCKRIVKN